MHHQVVTTNAVARVARDTRCCTTFLEAIGRIPMDEAQAKRVRSSGSGLYRMLLTWTAMLLVQCFSKPALVLIQPSSSCAQRVGLPRACCSPPQLQQCLPPLSLPSLPGVPAKGVHARETMLDTNTSRDGKPVRKAQVRNMICIHNESL